MSLINVNGVTLAYEGQPVVNDLSFSVENGDYICVVGENGSGKSTVIKALCGLVKPQKGSIVFENGKKRIGYLPQQTQIQKDFPATVFEVIVSGYAAKLGFSPFYGRSVRSKVIKTAERLGISELIDLCYRDLSGGQQQRVLLARALVAAENLIILDEPVTGLDARSTAEMYAIIDKLSADGVTVIMISHDMTEAVNRADKILHLTDDGYFFCNAEDYYRKLREINGGEDEE